MLSGTTSVKCGLVIMQSQGPASLGAFSVHCFIKLDRETAIPEGWG